MGYSISRFSRNDSVTMRKSNFDDITDGTVEMKNASSIAIENEMNTEILNEQINNAKMWPGIFETVWGSEFTDATQELFTLAARAMTELSKAEDFALAEEIASSILELAHTWGEQVLESLKIKSFIREVIPLVLEGNEYSVYSGQYFKAEPFYDKDKRLVKLFYFHVKETSSKCRIVSYYLECSHIIQPFYVLGLTCSDSHAQVTQYDRARPSYWVVRQDVMQDVKTRIPTLLNCEQGTSAEKHENTNQFL